MRPERRTIVTQSTESDSTELSDLTLEVANCYLKFFSVATHATADLILQLARTQASLALFI